MSDAPSAPRWRRLAARLAAHMEPAVFLPSALLVVGFVAFGAAVPKRAEGAFSWLNQALIAHFGWFYLLTAAVLLVLVVGVAASDLGRVRLGADDAKPAYSFPAWLSMLLAAGVGIGVVFFGVAEPVAHRLHPPRGEGSAAAAMQWTFFHWGLHPWAIYCTVALPMALYHHRGGLPLAPRTLLYPFLGDRIEGPIGHAVDVLCTVGTLMGVATSLGLGAMQINGGLDHLFGVPQGDLVRVAIIGIITGVATVSVVSGISKGIRRLSLLNVLLAAALLVFVLLAGPAQPLLELFVTSLGRYLQHLPASSLWVARGEARAWQADWTLFYWAWWLSWSPFVGIFVARISRGRTVREVVAGALVLPSLLTALWFAVVGGRALALRRAGVQGLATADSEPALSLYRLLEALPLPEVTTGLATLLIIVFFITSSDSGSLVDDMVTSGGDPDPPKLQRVFWAVSEGSVAATLLVAGGLKALRSASLATGLPMALLLWGGGIGLVRALRAARAGELVERPNGNQRPR